MYCCEKLCYYLLVRCEWVPSKRKGDDGTFAKCVFVCWVFWCQFRTNLWRLCVLRDLTGNNFTRYWTQLDSRFTDTGLFCINFWYWRKWTVRSNLKKKEISNLFHIIWNWDQNHKSVNAQVLQGFTSKLSLYCILWIISIKCILACMGILFYLFSCI